MTVPSTSSAPEATSARAAGAIAAGTPAAAAAETITTLPCRPDDQGEVVATLVRAGDEAHSGQRAVLYIHGYIDYYFHTHVAAAFAAQGYAFYALDLRKYGRSLRPHQTPWFCRSLTEYAEEITLALQALQAAGADDITLIGHSTGGLIAPLYAAEGAERHAIRRIVLNSPFLEFNEPPLLRKAGAAYAALRSPRSPYATLPMGISRYYGESLHKDYRGEWAYNLEWKPLEAPTTSLSWLRAIGEGHARVQAGLDLQQPILILHSDKSHKAGNRWEEALLTSDAVLDVEHMKRYGPGLGRQVTLHEIADAMHDVFLSREEVRTQALAATFDWLAQQP
jgi:alpha-beta hydrolase superfamily lysophospholipase